MSAKPVVQNNNVVVGVRIRPANEKEIAAEMVARFSASDDALNVQELNEEANVVKNWSYDYVFGNDCSNQYIFHAVGVNLVDSALEGYNAVLFMYGQTSSGKTFTLFGGGSTEGLVGHTLNLLDERVNKTEDTEFLIKMTYSELYNEELKDLLSVQPNENLKIIDDPNLGPMIQNVTEVFFTGAVAAKKTLAEGEARRHFGVTNMNAHSSRSHVLVRLSIESRKVGFKPTNPFRQAWGKDKPTSVSTLNLVDLAGSERSNKAGTTGESLKEGSFINKSLLTLGTVISNLSEGKEGAHIPYRNSKLTRLLAGALGGNAKTTMITCISPASGNLAESQGTLRFASRAKKIVNKVRKNDVMDAKTLASKLINQNDIIEALKQQMQRAKDMGFSEDSKGESIKDKAVATSKTLRSLKFLMMVTPKLVKALKDKAMHAEADAIAVDLQKALAGKKDMFEVIKSGQRTVERYLPTETKILMRFMDVQEANESDIMFDAASLGVVAAANTHESEDSDEENEIAGLFALQGSAANPEELEFYQMKCEDILAAAGNKIYHLQHSTEALVKKVARFKKDYEEAQRINEGLKHEMGNATAAHKNFQEDAYNARMQMKTQMEQLRSNMNNMLVRGGETTQILRGQTEELNHKIESMESELSLVKDSKKRLDQEVSFLRQELGHALDREKKYMSEQLAYQNAMHDNVKENQRLKNELANVVTPLAMSDQNNKKLRKDLADLSLEYEIKTNLKEEAYAELKTLHAGTVRKLEETMFSLKLETSSALTDRETYESSMERHRAMYKSSEDKLNEKMHQQSVDILALKENLQKDKDASQAKTDLLIVQNSKLQAQIQTLQETLASYEEFVNQEVAMSREKIASDVEMEKEEEKKARARARNSALDEEDEFVGIDSPTFPAPSPTPAISPASRLKEIAKRVIVSSKSNVADTAAATAKPSAAAAATSSSSTAGRTSPASKTPFNSRTANTVSGANPSTAASAASEKTPDAMVGKKVSWEEKQRQKEKHVKQQREFLDSPVPVLPAVGHHEQAKAARLAGLLDETPKFKALRLGLALVNATFAYSTAETLVMLDFVKRDGRSSSHQLAQTQHALAISRDEKASLQLAKISLDKNNALCIQREAADEGYIHDLEGQLETLRDQFSALTFEHTEVQIELKEAEAANQIWNAKYANLRSIAEQEEREKARMKAESLRQVAAMEDAIEKMYFTESQLGLKEQEYSILKVERDELAKRFYTVGSMDDEFTFDAEEKSGDGSGSAYIKPKKRQSMILANAKLTQ